MKLYAFILVAACLPHPAFAASMQDEQRREIISMVGVRLSDPYAVDNVRRKIDRAVRRVCAHDDPRMLISRQAQTCRKEARAHAERQLAHLMRQTRMAEVTPR